MRYCRRAAFRLRSFLVSHPLIIAHRGASGYRPEHTLDAYRLAIALGADYIEPDLVATADGVLVARHENELSATTDVAERPEFAARFALREVEGRLAGGWFVEDFRLDELRTLRARERSPGLRQRNTLYDGRQTVPTFSEIVALARGEAARLGRPVGVAPEVKLPGYFSAIGLPPDQPLLAEVAGTEPDVPVLVKSFDAGWLRRLSGKTSVPLAQLVAGDGSTDADLLTDAGLKEVSTYARVLGADKSLLVPRRPDGRLGDPDGLAGRARAAGLEVHAWTFRNENVYLPAEYRRGEEHGAYGDAFGEYGVFLQLGLDGVVTDHPDTAAAALRDHAPAGLAGDGG